MRFRLPPIRGVHESVGYALERIELFLNTEFGNISTFIWTLLDDADAATARATLGTDASGAQRPPQGPETTSKIIRGTVNTAGSGTAMAGTGWSFTRNGTGNMTVTFSAAFSFPPSVALGTNADSVTFITMPSTTSFRVLLRNESAGVLAAVDAQFTFVAVGPA